ALKAPGSGPRIGRSARPRGGADVTDRTIPARDRVGRRLETTLAQSGRCLPDSRFRRFEPLRIGRHPPDDARLEEVELERVGQASLASLPAERVDGQLERLFRTC